MFWTAGPALGVSLVAFFVLGLNADPDAAVEHRRGPGRAGKAFNISAL